MPMVHAVVGMERWKLNVMFVAGLAGMAAIVYWFAFPAPEHDHSVVEFVIAGVFFFVCAFFAFPLGVTRLADKFWPERWRKDQGGGSRR